MAEPQPGLAAILRPSADTDLDDIAAIYAHHVRHGTASFETEPPDAAEMRRRRAVILELDFPYLVVEEAGTLQGYAYAGTYRPRAAYRDTVENSVYLRPEAAGRGLGGMLLAALIDACAAIGLRQMVAVVGDSANLPSIRLHERLGFRHVGVLEAVGYKHGRWLDTVLLQRALGPGNTTRPTRP
jgi:L-amino acid N-acyltransferase YncA